MGLKFSQEKNHYIIKKKLRMHVNKITVEIQLKAIS